MRRLIIAVLLTGCGTVYVKPKGKVQTESNVKTDSEVNVNINLNIAEQIEKICAKAADYQKCSQDVIDLFNKLTEAINKTVKDKVNENSNIQQSVNGQTGQQQPTI